VFLGDQLLPYLVLAIGGALVVGNGLALVRPPADAETGAGGARPPLARSVVMILVGLVAAIWAIATLTS
jgi:hypothetical protein